MSKRTRQLRLTEYSSRNHIKLVKGGKDYFELLEEIINKAAHSIHLQFYIFLGDETGIKIMDALKRAAHRGVAVHLHLDGYASQKLPKKDVTGLKDAGVSVKWFEPLYRSKHFYFGRRMHHKVVVTDGLYSLVGGINVADKYNDMPGEPAWLDMALYCEGEASYVLYKNCREIWSEKRLPPSISAESIEKFCKHIPEKERTDVRVRRNDWVKKRKEIWNSYSHMFSGAEKNILIMCSYFLPGRSFRKKMVQAIKRGVDIKVILAGTSDIKIAKHAERYLYDWLLKNNIKIYEYQDTVLHAKVATSDRSWTTIGSYNINNISAYASLEVNMEIKDHSFALHTENELNKIITKHCKEITRENYTASTHFFRKLWQRICYGFVNNVLNLFTFYFRQEE